MTQKPARERLAKRVELESDTAVLIKGGNERKSGTEPKQRRWKVFRDPKKGKDILRKVTFKTPIRSVTAAQTTLPDKFATARDLVRQMMMRMAEGRAKLT